MLAPSMYTYRVRREERRGERDGEVQNGRLEREKEREED